jgi:hypothetical protein
MQLTCAKQAEVGANPVPRLEQHHVTRHQFARVHP